MNRHDNPYNLFPRDEYVVHLKHLHPGNSSRKERYNSKYFSHLTVWKRNETGEVNLNDYIHVYAQCSKDDTPSRSTARAVLRMKAEAAAAAKGWTA